MALRDLGTGEVLTFRACAVAMAEDRIVFVHRRMPYGTLTHLSGMCPEHESNDCVATYISADYMARWSLRDLWATWRRARRTGAAR